MFLLCTTFALVLGLYFGRNSIVISIIIALAYLIFVLYRFGKKKLVVVLVFFGIGLVIPRIPYPVNEGPEFKGTIIDSRDNYFLFESKFERYYVYQKDNEFEIGDQLVLKGEVKTFKSTSYESQFDFKDYLNNKGITKELIINA